MVEVRLDVRGIGRGSKISSFFCFGISVSTNCFEEKIVVLFGFTDFCAFFCCSDLAVIAFEFGVVFVKELFGVFIFLRRFLFRFF